MRLESAILMFLVGAYIAGLFIGFASLYYQSHLMAFLFGGVGVLLVYAIRKVAVNSIEAYLYDGIASESNRLCYEKSEEAMSLLAAGKYEELKILLIEKSATAEDEIRKLTLAYGEDK